MALTLVLGPRRSGKTAVAERLAAQSGSEVIYVAPLTVTDDELASRVAAHRASRRESWTTIETIDVVDALQAAPSGAVVLLDSLGTWIAEVLWRGGMLDKPAGADAVERLMSTVRQLATLAAARAAEVVIVAEEAGWGPVPPTAATRRWLDLMGDAAQELAASASRVLLVVAGRVLELP